MVAELRPHGARDLPGPEAHEGLLKGGDVGALGGAPQVPALLPGARVLGDRPGHLGEGLPTGKPQAGLLHLLPGGDEEVPGAVEGGVAVLRGEEPKGLEGRPGDGDPGAVPGLQGPRAMASATSLR